MANEWPANKSENWNTAMKANIDVGHDSDGTHKKSQMLTDMGWSPTAYTNEESVTFPNGLIFKQGITGAIGAGGTAVIGFAANFTALKSVSISLANAGGFHDTALSLTAKATTGITIKNGSAVTGAIAHWQAWGS